MERRRSALDVAGELDAVLAQAVLDEVGAAVADAVQQEVLAAGDGDLRDEPVGDQFAHRGAQLHAVAIGDLARRHGQPDDAVARAVVVLLGPRRLLDERRDLDAGAAGDLGADRVDAALLDRVLEAGPVAIVAAAPVALHRDHGLDDVEEVLG